MAGKDNKPFYQPWDEDAFQSGMLVRGMSHIQRWMYKSLLQSAFFCNTRPYLPADDQTLWILAGSGTIEEWQANKEPVLRAFDVRTEDGLLSHHRIIDDWNRVVAYRKKMKRLAKRSAEARAALSGRSAHAQQTLNQLKEVELEEVKEERENEKKESSVPLSPEALNKLVNSRW